ncbi:hypothetical protein BDR26DRAFT_943360 [Obelidium mucronatum]|nr:hypothetical protein BDR26DRAFT_943360 [Obelidium mucronatum]
MNGVDSAQYLPKFCQNRLCRWGAFDVDSCVFKDKEGSVRLYYQMEIIKTRGYIFLNDKYLITWDTLGWLCVDVVKDLKAKFWTSQQMYRNKFGQNALPAPADSALFKRAFVLFGFLRLAEWIKSHTYFTNSAPGLVTPEGFAIVRIVVGGDTKTMDDLEEGMLLYSQWFESYFVVKNKHSCELCHQVGLHEEVLSAIVDDGKDIEFAQFAPASFRLLKTKSGFVSNMKLKQPLTLYMGAVSSVAILRPADLEMHRKHHKCTRAVIKVTLKLRLKSEPKGSLLFATPLPSIATVEALSNNLRPSSTNLKIGAVPV